MEKSEWSLEKWCDGFYKERIGKVYGDFEVIDVQPADDMRNSAKQIWTLKCVHCGAIRTTRNGKDYVTGKNSGHCACMKEERKAIKLARIAAAREEREKIRKKQKEADAQKTYSRLYPYHNEKYVGQVFGTWKVLEILGGNGWLCECTGCHKKSQRSGKKVVDGIAEKCPCNFNHGKYDSKDWIGRRFGHLEIIGAYNKRNRTFPCECDCGNIKNVRAVELSGGTAKSCGVNCVARKMESKIYGCVNHRIANIWYGMHQRCYNPKSIAYKYYGARGISICDEWIDDYKAFQDWALSHGYSDELSIDRINNDGNYCPENCRWATMKEQMTNQRPRSEFNRPEFYKKHGMTITMDGETKFLSEWCEQYGLLVPTVTYRVKKKGMTWEQAIKSPQLPNGRPMKKVK